jgi:hypothetical protein
MDDRELISRAIAASGLSVRRFAREQLVRDPRTACASCPTRGAVLGASL